MNKVLEVKNLKTHFNTDKGVVKAVDGVTFDLIEGKTLGVVGESGCGKSITAMSVMRLIDRNGGIVDGTIMYEGRDLAKISLDEMRKIRGNDISIIFQEPMTSLNPVFRIGDQIVEAIKLHQDLSKEEAHDKAVSMLKLVGIPRAERVVYDYPHQLSGGMRQRAMIAMALACDPKILIADEPTTALDVTIQAQILALMNDLKSKTNTAIMLITHDLGVVAQMADDVIVMYSGKVVESAEVKELYGNPKHPYTQGLLDSIPDVKSEKKRLNSIEGVVPNPMELPKGCYFAPRCKFAMDKCWEQEPGVYFIDKEINGENHKVKCFLYEEN